jgi:hypothetical protein
MSTLEEIESLLYTYDSPEYKEHAWVPNYSFKIEKLDQILYYFGANHSRNNVDVQYEKLRTYWKEFLTKTEGINSIVLVEGGLRRLHPDEGTAIREDAEAGFITLLAHDAGVETYCPEPGLDSQNQYVLASYPREELEYYYFARMVSQWNRIPEPRPRIEEYVKGTSFEEMKRTHLKITGKKFDENDKEIFALLSDPTKESNPLHKLIQTFGAYRNAFIVQEIERLWSEGKNLFVVYGGAHAILQEPALRTLLK